MCAKPISVADSGRWVHVCRIEALAGRAIIPVFVAGRHLVLVQDGDGIFAAERACPHEGADLALGHCSGGRLFCPRHLAWFALANGAVSAGWSFRALRTYPTRREGGDIQVRIEARG
ncbi:Rieske (2Fe-2S) protein [Methylobacterium sp. Leaf93]|uniref:Rieske (2Fe-2S) protein n=1 Tax=Methylobacterium sp. Leaf93 TaxID=1736249 RepID=UPI0006F81582|nr:Rieske (2Fe-2S) protein [Methylobacterium sp. Leaf93]KQP05570.1 ferredoxin [Methylobacterium sp. Leaf93]